MHPDRHHTGFPNNMGILVAAQSGSNDLPVDSPVPAFGKQERRGDLPTGIGDTTAKMVYGPLPTNPILRASQTALDPESSTSTAAIPSSVRISDRELTFIITAAIFGMAVLLLGAAIAHLMRRRGRGQLSASRSADTQERGFGMARNFEDTSWGTKGNPFQEEQSTDSPCPPPPASTFTPRLSHPDVTVEEARTPKTELTAILEGFERRLYQEETDIALALHIAFGDESSAAGHCAPFFAGCEDDVNTMLSLQAGMQSVGKRSGRIRNRARQGSDASASSQSTVASVEGFSSHGSSASSLTSIGSIMSDIDENSEEDEEVVYEVKRARTHSMEIQKGKLITWQPGSGVRLMVTGPSTTTLGTASSSPSVDLDEFPLPP
ncbi:hypothetical protein B0H15DRAFT_848540 [Mycena belliarum]|uniref:Uncharacterized protein n=1 Tax=Mycena belliarum TaxID=1033014 RepID=A0AAD6XSF6_9AGAR|nr:hypothetical protein B0H15DRAFT_848540 [Mycena belliae]